MSSRVVSATPLSNITPPAAVTIRCRVSRPRRVSGRPDGAPVSFSPIPGAYQKLDWTTQFCLAIVDRVTQFTAKGTHMTSIDLAGSTALITGANSGIGRATAVRLARRGAHVLVSGRDPGGGEGGVAATRAAGGKADFTAADLADADSVRALARRAIELGGGHVDILVNNAGVFPFG